MICGRAERRYLTTLIYILAVISGDGVGLQHMQPSRQLGIPGAARITSSSLLPWYGTSYNRYWASGATRGSEGSADPPKWIRGPALRWTFSFVCGLPAVKFSEEIWKAVNCWQGGPTTTNYRSGPLTGTVRPLAKRNCYQIGPFNAYLPDRASTVAVKTGPF